MVETAVPPAMKRFFGFVFFFVLVLVWPACMAVFGLPVTVRHLDVLAPVQVEEESFSWGGPFQEHAWSATGWLKQDVRSSFDGASHGWVLWGCFPTGMEWDDPACDWYEGVREFHRLFPERDVHRLLLFSACTGFSGIDERTPCRLVVDGESGWVHVSLWGRWPAWVWW